KKVLQFQGFTLDPNTASLHCGARQAQLRPKSFDVLHYLARHPGQIITKDELIRAIWPNVFVTDNSLVQCISDIRAALDDDSQSVVKTVARRGYLFAAPVEEVDTAAQDGPPACHANEEAPSAAAATSDASPPGPDSRIVGFLGRHGRMALLVAGLSCAVA